VQISKDLFDLFKDLKDNVIALDSELNVTHVNSSQYFLFGLEPAKLSGKNIYAIAQQSAENIFEERILEAITKKEIVNLEWEDAKTLDLWYTTFFPAVDGIVMINKSIPVFI
jgi:PAS domain S-box-containing protein